MFLEGRPPVNVGVTSNGDVFGGTEISFGDVLGDQQFNFFVVVHRAVPDDVAELREPLAPLPVGRCRVSTQTQFFYGQGGVFYDPSLAPLISRERRGRDAHGARRHAHRHLPDRPLPAPRAVGRCVAAERAVQRPDPRQRSDHQQASASRSSATARSCPSARRSCRRRRCSASSARSPAARCAWRTTYAPKIGGTLSRQTFDADARHYLRLGTTGLLATRIRAFKSIGDFPDFQYFGGNSEMRGYDYLSFVGQNVVFGDAELRFPHHRGGADADRRRRRRARRVLREHGRRLVRQPAASNGGRRTPRPRRSSSGTRPIENGFIQEDPNNPGLPLAQYQDVTVVGLPPAGRPRLLRPRPRDLRPGLPDPLRLVVAHAVQQGLGGRGAGAARRPTAAAFRKPRFTVWMGYDF